jgi:hypothetical protein
MINKKNLINTSIIILVCIIFSFIYFNSPLRSYKNYPISDGTFIQLDLTQNWNSNKWRSELQYLKDDKMHYVIITGVSLTNKNLTKAVYKSSIAGVEKLYGETDPVDLCLKNAEKLGIKVFVETNFNDEWWQKSGDDPKWLYEQIYRMNDIADELYSKYHNKYPNAFYGWYFPYEVDNAKFNNLGQFSVLAKAIDINLKHLKERNERLPVMISPFMNSSSGTALQYENNWAYVFLNTELGKGDVFCPQDSVGSGRLNLDEVNPWFTALREAVDKKPGLLFWANSETFDYINNSSAPLDRFIEQMKLEQPCVDNIICFSYSHYYSPNNINKGFQKSYSLYVKSGRLEKEKPDRPYGINVQTINKNEFLVSWKAPENMSNIYGYAVYRNGVLVFSTTMQRKYGGNPQGLINSFVDKPLLKESMKVCSYEVKSFDFSGNLSDPTSTFNITVNPDVPLPNLLSKGCKYNLYPSPHEAYNDSAGTKLTDGIYSSTSSIKDKSFVGWYNDPINVTIDLGKIEDIQQFTVDYLREPIPWVELPSGASISISEDGVNFEPKGLFRIPTVPFSERSGAKYKIYLTLSKPVEARYVRLTSVTTPYTYTFIDEFEVRSK